jgi:RecB family exonuclease
MSTLTEIIIKAEQASFEDPASLNFGMFGLGAWSFSKYKMLQSCPFNFYLKYILKVKTPQPPFSLVTEVGKAAHRICELVIQGKSVQNSFLATKREFTPILDPYWEAQVETLEMSIETFASKLREFERVNKVKRYFTELRIGCDDQWRPTGFFGEDVFFRGVIDLCIQLENKDVILIDHKTGAPAEMGVKNFAGQLNTYKVLFHYGVEKLTGAQSGVHFIRAGQTKMGEYSSVEEVETKLLHGLTSGIQASIDRVDDLGFFKHISCNSCKYCDYRVECKSGELKPIELSTKRYFEIKEIK